MITSALIFSALLALGMIVARALAKKFEEPGSESKRLATPQEGTLGGVIGIIILFGTIPFINLGIPDSHPYIFLAFLVFYQF